MAMDDVVDQAEYAQFMQIRTPLASRCRSPASDPHAYSRLLEHIDTHVYYWALNAERIFPYEEAAPSWYDNVYEPLVEVIQEHDWPSICPIIP